MKSLTFFLSSCLVFLFFSCGNDSKNSAIEVHSVHENEMEMPKKLDVAVANTIDPICGMEIPKYLKDTLHLHNEIYGFCSTSCKKEFEKTPEDYLDKLN
ncbi:MAG: YHS domain-containing protein [Weeksellaceae bacterium]|jgi:YHS domain-containing protein|nr:YHS domain-containing protein [Weeksellaceae bacterium]MDX9705792.1 YHS domain-containing protein [Weeksellaceae bacterium]